MPADRPDESRLTVREIIVNALCEGFGHDRIASVTVTDDYTDVLVSGDDEAIRVEHNDVILPEKYHGTLIAAGIRLDVQAILVEIEEKEEQE